MEKLRKLNVCFYGCAALLTFICFFIPFGAGLSGSFFGATLSVSLYSLTFGDGLLAGDLVAWILMLLAFICFGGAIALKYLVKEDLCNVGTSAIGSVLALVAAILYFCTSAFNGGGDLGVAAIFNGILLILAALVGLVPLCDTVIKK